MTVFLLHPEASIAALLAIPETLHIVAITYLVLHRVTRGLW